MGVNNSRENFELFAKIFRTPGFKPFLRAFAFGRGGRGLIPHEYQLDITMDSKKYALATIGGHGGKQFSVTKSSFL